MMPPKDIMQQHKADQQRRFQDPATQPPDFNPAVGVDGFGPPDIGGGSKFANEAEINSAYANANFDDDDDEEYVPNLEPLASDEEDFGFTPPPPYQPTDDYPEPPSLRERGGAFASDQPIFPNGPLQSEVNSWKRQFEHDEHQVLLSEISDKIFIWRTLNRVEYREVMALPNTDPLQREEILCEICTLFPYEYNFTNMSSEKAGIPAVLADQIMAASGFKKPSPPIRL